MAQVPASIVTRNISDLAAETGNVYQSISIISKRANQISVKVKEELNSKLAEFATTVDNLEEVFENREQIEISKYYERLPKATNMAIEEFIEGKVYFRISEDEEQTSSAF
jgi:DNA-directed RNA polymerase subunit K/omega